MTTKRIVIIEGDAFDADAIVAIVKSKTESRFGILMQGSNEAVFDYASTDDIARDAAMVVAIEAWRSVVGYLPVVELPPTPSDPPPNQPGPEETLIMFWHDARGRYYQTYDGNVIWWGDMTGRFVWNEGPPRRKNPLGEGASPIVRVYVDEAGKPLALQPN